MYFFHYINSLLFCSGEILYYREPKTLGHGSFNIAILKSSRVRSPWGPFENCFYCRVHLGIMFLYLNLTSQTKLPYYKYNYTLWSSVCHCWIIIILNQFPSTKIRIRWCTKMYHPNIWSKFLNPCLNFKLLLNFFNKLIMLLRAFDKLISCFTFVSGVELPWTC